MVRKMKRIIIIDTGITYPEQGIHGKNILAESLINIKPKPMIYSMRAELIEDAKIKVVIPIPRDENNTWSWFKYCGKVIGWEYKSEIKVKETGEIVTIEQDPEQALKDSDERLHNLRVLKDCVG